MRRFIEWDSLDVRVDGSKLNAIVVAMIGGMDPIERIELQFQNGLLRVVGSIRKFFSVPFVVEIMEIIPEGTTVRVPLRSASAAGFPLPTILFGLLKSRLPRDLVTFEPPATLVMTLDRFLPNFVSADLQRIWIIDGGLAVTLGRGGADLPDAPIGDRYDGDITQRREDSGAGDPGAVP